MGRARCEAPCDFVLIDGDHHFEGVLADFYVADKLLRVGGFILLDDARAPAVESVINFVRSNRVDYEVADVEVPDTTVLRKVCTDQRSWEHFTPFEIANRSDWDLRNGF